MSIDTPRGFLWGVATSSHQVEGGNTGNDWHRWEEDCKVVNCEKSGQASDSWNRYEEDFDIAKSLGANTFRLSLEWSRIEPERGQFSRDALVHYRNMLLSLRARGLKTMVTLHHFTLPLWLVDRTRESWLDPELPTFFAHYTRRVVEELGDLVDFWITVNEPNVNMLLGYVVGMHPPGLKDITKAPRVLANFLKAHAKAYHIIHEIYPDAKVSIAHHARVFDPARWWHPIDRAVAGVIDTFWNHQPLRAIATGEIKFSVPFVTSYEERVPELKGTLDYLGINYYSRDFIRFNPDTAEKFEVVAPSSETSTTDVQWEIYPEGLFRVLKALSAYDRPIIITENGIADAADSKRTAFIKDHLDAMKRAMNEGVAVNGYIYWSLIDNFEWNLGYAPRFGLVEIDYETLERKPRPSAFEFQKLIKQLEI